jgi:hypothetical protein
MSYFDHPVRAEKFEAAIRTLVTRLLRRANRFEEIRLQIIFTGTTACALWSYENITDPVTGAPTGKQRITGTIKLPAIKPGSKISRAQANRWVAYCIHEVWHVVFTDSGTWRHFALRQKPLCVSLGNAIEDARIERSGMELGYAEGFKIVGADLLAHLLTEDGADTCDPNKPGSLPWAFAVGCRGYGVAGEAALLAKLDPRIAVILAWATKQVRAIPASIDNVQGTGRSLEIARLTYNKLKKLAFDPPVPPPPPPPPPPEEEKKRRPPPTEEGEGQPCEEGEEGEGEGNKQRGERPLKVGDKVECPDGSKGIISEIDSDDVATVEPL